MQSEVILKSAYGNNDDVGDEEKSWDSIIDDSSDIETFE